jgi:hypothetical protein
MSRDGQLGCGAELGHAGTGRSCGAIAAGQGPPDVLVNTIGAFLPGDALSTAPETLRVMIDVNLGPALWPRPAHRASGARPL